jgi:dTDP-4-amino-4,6-dideoxygalactose transaminase
MTDSSEILTPTPSFGLDLARDDRGLDAGSEMRESIPLVDLSSQQRLIAEALEQGWANVIEQAAFILGNEVETFERAYASIVGTRYCVGFASGTDALELILRAAGVGAGDEVIVPTNSFIATATAAVRAGATPVLVDVNPDSLLIDPREVSLHVTPHTKAIVAVHMFGQLAPMEGLRAAVDDSILLVEDAAHAHGASRHGKAAGTFGVAAATSFYPGKNLGAYGDAGAVLTDEAEVAGRVRALRNHGSEEKYAHPELGFNSRLDTLQAVVLSAKLPYLHAWNDERRQAAAVYHELLERVPEAVVPGVEPGNEHVWHLYVVRVPNRDAVLRKLDDSGIRAGVHYPIPIHLQGAFKHLGYTQGDFPIAEQACREILSLPIYPGITTEQQERVVRELQRALR